MWNLQEQVEKSILLPKIILTFHYLNKLFLWSQNFCKFLAFTHRYTYRVLQTIQMKVILLWVWAERAVLGSTKTALKFKYEI